MIGMLISKEEINLKSIKYSVLFLMLISLFLSIDFSSSYFGNISKIKNNFETIGYYFYLDSNGGIYNTKDITIKNNTLTLPTPTRKGYTFQGYSEIKNGSVITSEKVEKINLINDKTIYAKWNLIYYKITYNLNGGKLSNAKQSYTVDDSFTIMEPTRTGYNFIGWTGTGLTTSQKRVLLPKGSTGNRTYTATWEKIDAALTGITIVSYRSEDYGKTYETWYGNADGYYKIGTSNENKGNWNVTVSNHSVTVVGTTNVTSKNRYYKFMIYAGDNKNTLLGTVEDHPVEYRGSGTKAKVTFSW